MGFVRKIWSVTRPHNARCAAKIELAICCDAVRAEQNQIELALRSDACKRNYTTTSRQLQSTTKLKSGHYLTEIGHRYELKTRTIGLPCDEEIVTIR